MKNRTQPKHTGQGDIVRLSMPGYYCHVAGVIERETDRFYYTKKTVDGFVVRTKVSKSKAHLDRCQCCKSPEDIREQYFQDGIDACKVA